MVQTAERNSGAPGHICEPREEMCRGVRVTLQPKKGASMVADTHQETQKQLSVLPGGDFNARGRPALGPHHAGCREGGPWEPRFSIRINGHRARAASSMWRALRQEKKETKTEQNQTPPNQLGRQAAPPSAVVSLEHCFHGNTINSVTGMSQVLGELSPLV